MKRTIFGLSTLLGLSSTVFATVPSINPTPVPPTPEMVEAVEKILGAAQWIGFVVGVAMIIYVGVKYLTAGAGQKAEVKSTMIPILIGAALVSLAPTIAKWLFGMFATSN